MAASNTGGGSMEGWNDPPLLSYNPGTGTGTSPRTRLNKRVGYPLTPSTVPAPNSSNESSDGSSGVLLSPDNVPPKLPPIQILPPTTSTTVNPPVPLLVPQMSPPVNSSSLPPSFASAGKDPQLSETLPELLERLQLDSTDALRKYTKRILHETVDKLKDSIQGRAREDVQKKLSVLDDQWRDDKLSDGAKVKLGCLASALVNDDLKQADALHLSLMVDHISEVSQWMVGVKRLVNELKLTKASPQASSFERVTPSDPGKDICIDPNSLPAPPMIFDPAAIDASKPTITELQEGKETAPKSNNENVPDSSPAAVS